MNDHIEIHLALRVLDSDRERPTGRLIADLQERTTAALDLQRPFEQLRWRIVGEENHDATRLVRDLGGVPSERSVALKLSGQLVVVEAAAGGDHGRAGLRARTIADDACWWTRCVGRISIVSSPAACSAAAELGFGERAGDAAGPGGHVGAWSASSMSGSAITSETAKRPPGRSTRAASRQHPRLVAGEVDHAVRDDDVDGRVVERHVLEIALHELDVVHARLGGVGARELEHLIGHVEPDRLPGGADAARGDQHVGAGARPEVEHGLAVAQVRDRGRHAAARATR